MTRLARVAAWVEEHLSVLEGRGAVSLSYGPSGTDDPSAHLLVVMSPTKTLNCSFGNLGPSSSTTDRSTTLSSNTSKSRLRRTSTP